MTEIVWHGLLVVGGYLVGTVPSGYLLVRAFRGLDVREYGSHNVGAINTFRVGGKVLGTLTLLADVGKAVLVVIGTWLLVRGPGGTWVIAAAAFAVLVGHAFSIWFYLRERRFSEGKSVASCLGVLVGLAIVRLVPWWVPVAPLAVWGLGLLGPKVLTGRWWYISPVTMTATVSVPIVVALARPAAPLVWLAVAMCALILIRHKNNIRRLRAGTEPRLRGG